ncbi:MAG: 30S ribosomal protein S17 [Gammaproteobacteria bacterium]|jgi:small subunit ribosomal protein S17|nr:MAG: 30S ribosomal protein S17 [Gammaproteobacteria bacterium]
MNEKQKKSKTLTGIVVGNKMDKTINVRIERTVQHPLYEKILKRTTKILAHDENNECNEGDEVIIESSRPMSKRKSWALQKIVNRAQKV